MASDGVPLLAAAASPQIELAWHLLTVLLRLGRPASPSDLAVSLDLVELLCRIPGSPLRLAAAGGGCGCVVVTASEAAIVAFGRFVGYAVAPLLLPRVRARAPEVRRRWGEVAVKYARKRKAPDAEDLGVRLPVGAKRRLLMAPERDVEESKQQLIVGSIAQIASEEVHLEVAQVLQNRLLSLSTLIVEPSLNFSIGRTLASSISNITIPCSQLKSNNCLEENEDCSLFGHMASALVHNKLLDALHCFDDSPLDAEILKGIHETADNESNRIAEPEGGPSFHNCRVEDSEDLGEEPTQLPVMSEAGSIQASINEMEKVLIVLSKESDNPIDCNAKSTDNVEKNGAFSYQEDAPQDAGVCAANHEMMQNLLVCPEDAVACEAKAPPDADACGINHETTQSLFGPPIDTKVEPAVQQSMEKGRNCNEERESNFNADIMAGDRESVCLNVGEQLDNQVGVKFSKKGQDKKINKHLCVKQKEKSNKTDALTKEVKEQLCAKTQKSHVEPKPLPNLKSFIIEEEEGSGGYGTVYKARRKTDGKTFAIKCPHANAHSHHVNNELKMLERFGGRNFVIKYEGSFRSGDLECFVLEHVEHDRPEILKKEIDVFGLQWYGYCMFRALTSLHRQGIVHRDVKPGNFLFSRKLNKGYLIDFNLANDLHQKFLRNYKSETTSSEKKDATSLPTLKSTSVNHAKEAANDPKQPLISKRKRSNRSPMDTVPKIDNKSRYGSQAADISGVTSAKDPTSTKTSGGRVNQPMPYKGRKELMNFLHEAMQSPNQKTSTAPASQRKRVAAPFGKVDRKLFILTPMPLHSGGSAVAGSGMSNSKGNGKPRREGPCVGTKGFRAPEVLFRSFHQGCKVDVWSAGVTLLYLIIGKTPFGGDPEQNIKEIAKLRGSEDLWEVAKLHNCESSYPSELSDVRSLQSVGLREWCAANTRRPEFLKMVPDSLFDLVDRCLTVNPRCRITSEEALMHDFFALCHDSLRKQRMLRRSPVSEPACLPQDMMMLTLANEP